MDRGVIRSWLAVDDEGEIVGITSLLLADVPPLPGRPGAREGFLVNVYVEPSARRLGIARAMLDAALAIAPSEGLRGFHLLATDEGRPLYDELGFRVDDRFMVRPA